MLTGSSFPTWAAPAETSVKVPETDGIPCLARPGQCSHNTYEQPEIVVNAMHGVPVERLLGYRWDGTQFVQMPFQVDERAVRYLSNNASGFSFYSQNGPAHDLRLRPGAVPVDREDPLDPCHALPDGPPSTPDPVPGLDTDDEVVVHGVRRRGLPRRRAPRCPKASRARTAVALLDPYRPGSPKYVYVMLAAADAGCASCGVRRPQRLRALRARRRQRHVRLLGVERMTTTATRSKGAWFDPDDAALRDRRPAAAPPEGHRMDPHAALRVPLRRPLAHDRRCVVAGRAGVDDRGATGPTSSISGRHAHSSSVPVVRRRAAATRKRSTTGAARRC